MSIEADMARGRERVAEVRREVGWPTDSDDYERITPELQERYIEALEATVAGQASAMTSIARAWRG